MIVEINLNNIKDINKPNQPFNIIGKIIPVYQNDMWTFTECLYNEAHEKYYPNDDEQYEKSNYAGKSTQYVCQSSPTATLNIFGMPYQIGCA